MTWLHWSLLSALFAGLTAILAKVGLKEGTKDLVDADLALALRVTVVLVFAWAISLARNTQSLATIPARSWLFLTLSGLATGASWLCYFRALKLGDASRVAPIDKLSVVIVMVLGVFVLQETLTWKHWAGGALIVSGTLLLALDI